MTFRTAVSDGVVTALGYAAARRRVVVGPGAVKVNLGSGLTVAPGWINVDASLNTLIACLPRTAQRLAFMTSGARRERSAADYLDVLCSNRFVFADLRRPLPFADGCADFVFTSHLLEHLTHAEALRLLGEVCRILKPGGVVRVVVPDLRHFVEAYLNGDADAAVRDLFSSDVPGALGQHRFMYDAESLGATLEHAGFHDVKPRAYLEGATPDLERLDTRPEESLYVEGRR
jgi:predicted SAM-dependent methyltransferase